MMLNTFLRAKNPGSAMSQGPEAVATPAAESGDVTLSGAAELGFGPIGDIAVDIDTKAVVVTNPAGDVVSVLDEDGHPMAAVDVPAPVAVALSNDRAYVIATTDDCDGVAVIDTNSKAVIATYPLAFTVATLTVSPDGKRVYAGRVADDRVDIAVIDITADRVGTMDVANGPGIGIDAVRVDANGKRVYAATTDAYGSRLIVMSAETMRVEATIHIGKPIRDLAIGVDGHAFVLTSDRLNGGALVVVDLSTNAVTETFGVGRAPTQLAVSPDCTRAYVVDYDRVAVMCALSGEMLDSVTVGARPSCVAVSGERVYVADYAGGLAVFSASAPTMPLLYEHFIPTDVIAASVARELVPAGV